MLAEKKSTTAKAHRPAAPVECRGDAWVRVHANSYDEGNDVVVADCQRFGQLKVRPRLARESAGPAGHSATKAKPKHASKRLPNLKSTFGLCRGKKHKTSLPESRWPGPRPC